MELSQYSLRYFRAARYQTEGGTIDHFRLLPRPVTSIGFLINGDWGYTEYIRSQKRGEYLNKGIVPSGQLLYVPFGATYDAHWMTYPRANCVSLHFELASAGIFNQRYTSVQCVSREELEREAGISVESEFEAVLDLFNRSLRKASHCEFELMSRLYNIIGGLERCLERKADDEFDEVLEPAIAYLQNNPEKPVSVSELARLCKLSESYFYARFHRATGLTPIAYKNRLMISRAQSLLIDEPSLPIEVIVDRCGFSSSAYFRKLFRSIVGYSPREYRTSELKTFEDN